MPLYCDANEIGIFRSYKTQKQVKTERNRTNKHRIGATEWAGN